MFLLLLKKSFFFFKKRVLVSSKVSVLCLTGVGPDERYYIDCVLFFCPLLIGCSAWHTTPKNCMSCSTLQKNAP